MQIKLKIIKENKKEITIITSTLTENHKKITRNINKNKQDIKSNTKKIRNP